MILWKGKSLIYLRFHSIFLIVAMRILFYFLASSITNSQIRV